MVTNANDMPRRHVLSLSVLHIYRDRPCFSRKGNEETPEPLNIPFSNTVPSCSPGPCSPVNLCRQNASRFKHMLVTLGRSPSAERSPLLQSSDHRNPVSVHRRFTDSPGCFKGPALTLTAVFNYNRLTASESEGPTAD